MKFDRPNPKHGTEEDLRKMLLRDYPGCRSIAEALEKEKQRRSPPQDLCVEKESYEVVLSEVIDEISNKLNGFDIDLLDKDLRLRLSKMPIDSIENLKLWRDAWLVLEFF